MKHRQDEKSRRKEERERETEGMVDADANEKTDGRQKDRKKNDNIFHYMRTDTHQGYWFILKVSSAKRVADTQALFFIRCSKAGRAGTYVRT